MLKRSFLVAPVLCALGVAACGGKAGGSGSGSSQDFVTLSPANGSTLPNGSVGASYSQTITVIAGAPSPYTFNPTGLPPGMLFATVDAQTSLLYGTPTQAGTGIFQLQVRDGNNNATEVNYTLTIDGQTGTLTLSPASLPAGTRNQLYNQALSVTGGTAPYVWRQTSGTLPPGVVLGSSTTATQTLLGSPSGPGTFTFTITVNDSSGKVGSLTYALTIS